MIFGSAVLYLLPLFFLVLMIAMPLFSLAQYGGMAQWQLMWQDSYMHNRIAWTAFQAAITAALVCLLGVPIAYVLSRFEFLGRAWLLRLQMLPFVMPTLVAGIGVLGLFGNRGLLWSGWQDTPYLLIYGNVFFNLPVLVRAAFQGFCQVPAARIQAAQTLGASAWAVFWRIQFPTLLPWLAGGACLVFLYCFSGFGLALLLGGQKYATVEVEIYQLIAYELDMTTAALLVWLVLGITFVSGVLYAVLSRYAVSAASAEMLPRQNIRTLTEYAAVAVALLLLLCCCLLPLLAIVVHAAAAGDSWRVLSDSTTWLALFNTFRFTTSAMLLAILLGICHAALAHRWTGLRSLTFLPFMVSPVCVSFGLLVLYPQWAASFSMLICTYALLAYPFITKDMLAAWDALPPRFIQAARTLGASPWQTWCWITFPLLRPALRRGLALAAATCVGEFAATLFLSRPEWQTLTTLIYQYLSTAGQDNYDRAMVLTALLALFTLFAFVLFETAKPVPKETSHAHLA
ncbi:ABC transporter permease [Stenoxybacter acetivorans]|uniref:ABC transporter permease n=1 Tax=Stenoxybacter acetivorans TaxID=422441 RepID=UPI000561698F|nr:iron ABC transporter permease [Stenoxybacter acetivorans]